MKKTNLNLIICKSVFVILIISLTNLIANAQKAPQIQEISVRAPENVKIDGKIKEWPNPFQTGKSNDTYLSAYNSSSRVYYTVANDDKNLYFVIRGLGSGVANKMLAGGLTITISHADKKREKAPGNVVITFPVPQDIKTIVRPIMGQLATVGNYVDDDTIANKKEIEQLGLISDKMANDAMKEIRVVGVKEIPDSVVSVYNTEGIKAALQFIKRQPVVEIAMPLKYLALSTDNPVKFSYNIKMGAIPEVNSPQDNVAIVPNAPVPVIQDISFMKAGTPMGGGVGGNGGFLYNPTDFWGYYTLVKK